MSKALEVIRNIYVAFGKGDIPSVLGALASDIRWTEAEGGPYGGVSIGPQSVLDNVFMKLGSEWDDFSAVANEFIANDDVIVVLGDYSGSYKSTGKSLQAPFAHVWRMQNGKAISFDQYTDTAMFLQPMK